MMKPQKIPMTVALFQGGVTVLAKLFELLPTAPAALTNLSLIRSILTFCIGINLIWKKNTRRKPAARDCACRCGFLLQSKLIST